MTTEQADVREKMFKLADEDHGSTVSETEFKKMQEKVG